MGSNSTLIYTSELILCFTIKEIYVRFVTMASRFGIVDEEGIDELKELSENENTKKSTEQWKNVFVKWATERGKEKKLEAISATSENTRDINP